jgi:type II secretory pathway component PulM
MITERLNQLEQREQYAIIGCAIFVVAFFIYQFIWTPLDNKLDKMKRDISYQTSLIGWISSVSHKISSPKLGKKQPQNLLSETADSLMAAKLNKLPHQLRQSEGDKIELDFKLIPYTQLISWVENFWYQYDITVETASITNLTKAGVVKASLVFQKRQN